MKGMQLLVISHDPTTHSESSASWSCVDLQLEHPTEGNTALLDMHGMSGLNCVIYVLMVNVAIASSKHKLGESCSTFEFLDRNKFDIKKKNDLFRISVY